jgi:hypothetical protein
VDVQVNELGLALRFGHGKSILATRPASTLGYLLRG